MGKTLTSSLRISGFSKKNTLTSSLKIDSILLSLLKRRIEYGREKNKGIGWSVKRTL